MSERFLLGFFEDEDDVMGATRALRASGFRIADIYAPYAVHGLDKAMGLKPSRLPWICFALGLAGAAFKVWFEIWTSATDWPINVGGKPFNSLLRGYALHGTPHGADWHRRLRRLHS